MLQQLDIYGQLNNCNAIMNCDQSVKLMHLYIQNNKT